MVEDHPVEYLHFAGHIAEGNYGAGEVTIWDTGRYELVTPGDLIQQIERGKCSIILHGKKLRGEFQLVRMAGKNNQWLLIKSNDDFASPEKSDTTGNDPKPKVRHAIRAAEPQLPRRQVQSRAHNVRSLTQALRAKELPGEVTSTMGEASLSLTHLDKLYWPDEGYTKGDLLRYYCEVAPSLLAHLKGRPLILLRYPNGITAPSFYQHDVDQVPVFARTFPARAESGKVVDYVVCDNLATLLYVVNLGTIALSKRRGEETAVESLSIRPSKPRTLLLCNCLCKSGPAPPPASGAQWSYPYLCPRERVPISGNVI